MGKIISTTIRRFDGGIKNDVRDTSGNGCRMVKNFDILTFPNRLRPYNSTESGNDTVAREIENFLYAGSRTYGYGVQTGTARTALFFKDTYTDGTWTTLASAVSGALTRQTECFVYYRGSIYGGQTNRIWSYDISGGTWNDADLSLTHTTIAQGLVFSSDILFIPYDNKIAKYDGSTWTNAALTLPTNAVVTSITEYGNYLAIACKPLSTAGKNNSTVYLWDTTSTTWSEVIDWGAGNLEVLAEYQGYLVGITAVNKKWIVKVYTSSGARTVIELEADSTANLSQRKQVINDKLHFMGDVTIDGTRHWGIWSVFLNKAGQWALANELTPNNDTAPIALYGFIIVNESVNGVTPVTMIAYNDGAGEQVSKTINITTTYSASSTYETATFDIGDASIEKKLLGVTLTYAPLPTAGSVTLGYRIDAETSFTTIFTDTTDSSISHSAVTVESTGKVLPKFKEIQFKITSTGGGSPTSLEFSAEPITKKPY